MNLLFYGLEPLGLELFQFILSFAHIGCLYLFVDFLGSGRWRHLGSTYFTMSIAHRIEHCTCATLPFHHQPFTLLLLLFLFLILLLNLFDNLFLHQLRYIPPLHTYAQFIILWINIKLRRQDLSFIFTYDLLDFCDKLCAVHICGDLFNQ